ncbi:MAG: hypothetical protein ABFD46_09445 [Armatimonadota bacterium]
MKTSITCGLMLVLFALCCSYGYCVDTAGGYAVVVSSSTYADASWKDVVDTLVAKHDADLVTYSGTAFPTSVQTALSEKMPRYVCFVGQLSELGKAYVQTVYQLSRSLDSDIYGDFIWGILTGYNAADAKRVVESPSLSIRKGLTKTCPGWIDCLRSGIFHSEVDYTMMWVKPDCQPIDTTQIGPVDDTSALVSEINTNTVDLVVSSGHASQSSWQLHYPNVGLDGMFYSNNGLVYGKSYEKAIYNINSTNPKVYYAPGNCLIGLAYSVSHMVPSWIHSGGVVQFAGYVVTTDNGYMGWGVYNFFMDMVDRYTFAESIFLTNQSLLFDQEFVTPGIDQSKLTYDRDVYAIYGDPAYQARVEAYEGGHTPPYSQSLTYAATDTPGVCRFTMKVKLNYATNMAKPVFAFLPFRIGTATVVSSNARQVRITDDMAIMQLWAQGDANLTAGQEWQLVFESQLPQTVSIKSAKALPKGTLAGISDAVVTAAFEDYLYVESEDRSMGIRVDKPGHGILPNAKVTVYGTLATQQGERTINAAIITPDGSGEVGPVGMTNKEIGGEGYAYDPALRSGQMGITGATGLSNTGLLITAWGKVTYSEDGIFYIDDGSGIKDGSGYTGVKVYGNVPTTEDPVGKWVKVIGISSCETQGTSLIRVIRPRDANSVELLGP